MYMGGERGGKGGEDGKGGGVYERKRSDAWLELILKW